MSRGPRVKPRRKMLIVKDPIIGLCWWKWFIMMPEAGAEMVVERFLLHVRFGLMEWGLVAILTLQRR